MLDYLRYSAKAIWGLVLPIAIPLVNDAADWLDQQASVWIAGAATAVVVWLQRNAPRP